MRRPLLTALLAIAACGVGAPDEPLGVARQANVCASGPTLEGVDVSAYDQAVDWTQVKASGRPFGIAKATEGSTFVDPKFATNWSGMKSASVVRSAYHFFHCDSDPMTQASFFLGVMGPLEQGDLPPTLDFEDITTCTSSTGVAMAVEWLDAVAQSTGTLPILYTSVNVLGNFTGTQAFAGHAQLWVASRGVTCPNLPAPFTTWSIWQYSFMGTVPGIPASNGVADLDQFNGDMNALLALTVGGSGPTPPTCMVSGVAGTCIDTSVCAAMPGYMSTPGLCPGPASEQCCTAVTGSSSSTSATASATAQSSSTASTSTSVGAGGSGGAVAHVASGGGSGCSASAGTERDAGEWPVFVLSAAVLASAARSRRRTRRSAR